MNDLPREFLLKLKRFKPEEVDFIIENTAIETFRKGEIILQEGSVCKKCYLVIQGALRQFKLVDGTEKVSAFFFEGDPVVSYSSYLNSSASEYSIQCFEDSILISGTREKELDMHSENPVLEYITHHIMVDDFKKAEDYISLLNNFSPEERYLQLVKNNPEILKRAPLIYIASYLGITPESLSRIRRRTLEGKK